MTTDILASYVKQPLHTCKLVHVPGSTSCLGSTDTPEQHQISPTCYPEAVVLVASLTVKQALKDLLSTRSRSAPCFTLSNSEEAFGLVTDSCAYNVDGFQEAAKPQEEPQKAAEVVTASWIFTSSLVLPSELCAESSLG
eukprot:4637667-Amphidinium_carterae.1